jgi:hypothetical protein
VIDETRLAEIAARCEAATRRPIPGFAGYEADTDGQIWSVESNWRGYGVRRLVQAPDPDGYPKVRVRRNGRRIRYAVHRLVALAFYGLPSPHQEVRHLNGDRQDNRAVNLQWGTKGENANDRARHGRTAFGAKNGVHTHPETVRRGEENPFSKLTTIDVIGIRSRYSYGATQVQLGRMFNVSRSCIGLIVNRRTWQHVD